MQCLRRIVGFLANWEDGIRELETVQERSLRIQKIYDHWKNSKCRALCCLLDKVGQPEMIAIRATVQIVYNIIPPFFSFLTSS